MDTIDGSVLGVTDFGPVEGSSLIPPPSILTIYFVVFLILLLAVYLILHKRKKPPTLWHKFKLLTLTALFIKIFLIGGVATLVFYWLVPKPSVVETNPTHQYQNFSPTNKVEILFDRPVLRGVLEKAITPETPGRWVFENSLYSTHLYRKVVFYPTFSLRPDTTYTITLSNIQSISQKSSPYIYQFAFKTQKSPKILAVMPVAGEENVNIDSEIKVKLSGSNNNISQFDFELTPSHPLAVSRDTSKTIYILKSNDLLKQGTKYTLKIRKTDVILDLQTASVLERGQTTSEYEGTFTTREAPGIKSFEPQGYNAPLDSLIAITFSGKMDKKNVEENFSIEPEISGILSWIDDSSFTFKPQKLKYETEYKVKIAKGAKGYQTGFIEQDVIKSFSTLGRVKVVNFTPTDGWSGVNINSDIKIAFDQEVDKTSAESKFAISPQVSGTFIWSGNTLTFTPDKPFSYTTTYKVAIATGVKSRLGLDSKTEFKSEFTTQDTTTKLAVPVFLQKYALSCELAALRMALAFRGIDVSEDLLLSKVGVDLTPHNGDVWGDPYAAFVGNVRGKQMADGYGVHWEPIARVAREYGKAASFSGWSINQLTQSILLGNPVIIWVYSAGGWSTHWFTTEGKRIYAARDEHAVTVVGFVGLADNPSQIIVNDPLVGQVYWGRNVIDKKWDIFGKSGVVIN